MFRQQIKKNLLEQPRLLKQMLAILCDALICALATGLAMDLRAEQVLPWSVAHYWMLAVGVALAVPVFTVLGLYRAIFRYAGLQVLYTLNKALLVYTLGFALVFTLVGVPGVPKSMGLLQPIIFALGVIALRLFVRYWLGNHGFSRNRMDLPRVLVYGAGSAGRQLAMGLGQSHEVQVVGYVDDDDRLHGHVLNGLMIHDPAKLPAVVSRQRVHQIYLALPSATRRRRNEIIENLLPLKVQVRTLPGLMELADGKVEVSDLKELDIEDLLCRDPVPPNPLLISKNTTGKVVLVTGAGGSIGSELCRQILKTKPRQLLLVEMSEFALYQIHQDLQASMVGEHIGMNQAVEGDAPEAGDLHAGVDIEIVPLLASVCDEVRMQEIMDTWKPHTVYHAAAYKHVPLVEHNPAEGVRNNVWGTRVCAQAAARNGVRNFVLISTDKAVRPTNIMGATKRLAEMVLQALAEVNAAVAAQGGRAPSAKTTFSMVRFGNVLGSSGSVVPLFREQIKNGGPITLTHADITRYFMTIPEAAQLVIQAGAMGQGGDVFVLDMGQPVKIIDLARRMVELSGMTVRDELNPGGDIELTVTGLRPGEKLYEELLIGDNPKPTQHPRIMKAHEHYMAWPQLEGKLNALSIAMSVNDVPVIRALLKDLVSGYQPSGEVVDWVHMALEREALALC